MSRDALDVESQVARIAGGRAIDDPSIDEVVLATLMQAFRAIAGRIYTLKLARGWYETTSHAGPAVGPEAIDGRSLRAHNSRWGPLQQAAGNKRAIVRRPVLPGHEDDDALGAAQQIVLPVLRQTTVVALVDLHSGLHLPPIDEALATGRLDPGTLASLQRLASAHEVRTVRHILEQTARFKVELYEESSVAIDNLMEFVAESSGMQFTALRRRTSSDALVAISSRGFAGARDDHLTFLNFSRDYEPFAYVVEQKAHWSAPSLDGDEYRAIRDRPELKDVRSFVACPVLLGNAMWGVLSFAAAVEYEYTDLEIYALRVLANLAGVALDAAEAADRKAAGQYNDGRLMQSVLANEVIVSTRHEMNTQIELLGTVRSALNEIIDPLVNNPNRRSRLTHREVDDLAAQVRFLDSAHAEIRKIVDTITLAQKELRKESNPVAPYEAWRRAKESFTYRINRLRVTRVEWEATKEIVIVGSQDWLRIVFMHLFLNSLDAFERNYTKGRREIVVRLEDRSKESVRFRYYDNAGGIAPHQLHRHGEPIEAGIDVSTAIFERYVTSKKTGTGLGLASCRAALVTMEGDIELVDSKRGVTFDITLKEWGTV